MTGFPLPHPTLSPATARCAGRWRGNLIRKLIYARVLSGISRWRRIVTIVGMDAKDRKIEQLERWVAEQAAKIKTRVRRVAELKRKLAKAISKVTESMKSVYAELVAALPSQPYVRSNETGHKENDKRFWRNHSSPLING